MANSSFIGKAKNKIIREFIKDQNIISAIGSNDYLITEPEKYINTHIFNYHQNPSTLTTVSTFITIQVHIPTIYDTNKKFVNPTIEIWVISNQRHMIVDNIPKITQNRNDYLAELIDRKLNGSSNYGIGDLYLKSNVEGAYANDYLYRRLIFEGSDINDSLCDEEY